MKSVILAHQTVVDGDAIGNDILGMYTVLKKRGYSVYILADHYLGSFSPFQRDRATCRDLLRDTDTLLIYHHSIFWEGGWNILQNCRGTIIFKFHNITPPSYFQKYSTLLHDHCLMGIQQTKELISSFDSCSWCVDSEFNGQELVKWGLDEKHMVVVPPFNQLPALERTDPDFGIIHQLIKNKQNNILFVGRIAPNKGHMHLIQVIRSYTEMYDEQVHLWIIGSLEDSLRSYMSELRAAVDSANLRNHITFIEKLPVSSLKSYYLGCDEFMCMSEHEGFCVPLIEAQYLMLPVISATSSALRETAGQNQVACDYRDYSFAAAALYTLFTDKNISRYCQNRGLENVLSRFSPTAVETRFLEAIQNITGGGVA